jgi:(2Fe-2S) ferredoxin
LKKARRIAATVLVSKFVRWAESLGPDPAEEAPRKRVIFRNLHNQEYSLWNCECKAMKTDDHLREVIVCLGSSCFARGNSQHLAAIEAYLQSHGLSDEIRVTGRLCQDECKEGPNLTSCSNHYHNVTSAKLREILQQMSTGAH